MGRKAYIPDKIKRMIDDGSLLPIVRGAWTEREIFNALNISAPRWYELKREIPELAELINTSLRSRAQVFNEVKGAMFQRATGCSVTETETEEKYNPDGTLVYKTIRTKTKYLVPELGAQKLILGNLSKAEALNGDPNSEIAQWRNNPEPMTIRAEGSINSTIDEDIKAIIDNLNV